MLSGLERSTSVDDLAGAPGASAGLSCAPRPDTPEAGTARMPGVPRAPLPAKLSRAAARSASIA